MKPRAKDPLILRLVELVDADERSVIEIMEYAGVGVRTYQGWRRGGFAPILPLFHAVLNTLGYELKIVKKEIDHGG